MTIATLTPSTPDTTPAAIHAANHAGKNSHEVVNINADTNITLDALNGNYEANNQVSTEETKIATTQAEQQANLATLFQTTEDGATVSTTNPPPYGWSNHLYLLNHLTPQNDPNNYQSDVSKQTALYNSDQTMYQSVSQQMGTLLSQTNQTLSQNAQTNQTADPAIGNAINSGKQNLTQMMMKG